ncbi:P-loop containing nucleoside triphosphate hydrolase protein [Boletus edulis]|nr:P-loop containing nucleoside triphosphate hydrolase protein [Boletus edulis]
MAKQKHAELTTDDLLKLQEGPPSKRIRVSPTLSVDPGHLVGSDDESGSTSSASTGVDPTDQEEDSQDDISLQGQVDEDQDGSGRLGTADVLKLSRTSPISTHTPRLAQIPKPSIRSFNDMGISSALEAALHRMSIHTPTEVQAACIPPILAGRDCIGHAKTGSGKTIAFAIPILQQLSVDPYGIFALVLTPTRELAFQISEQFAVLGAPLSIRTSVIVGGMDMMTQALELDGRPHAVVATPGRIVDHLKSSSGDWDLSRIKFLVLDEADRLLTPTFTPELSYLFNILPTDRQTCLFTATLTPSVESVASVPPKRGKMKPFFHRTESTVETVASLKQCYILCYLFYLLCNPPEDTLLPTIIFCTKPRTAAYITSLLKTLSIRSTALHSRLTQRERLASLSLFRSAVVPVLVSTDVGARGLDIEDVAIVINWDLPNEPEEYTHRDEQRILRIEDRIGIKLTTLTLPEDRVLDKLNAVSTAKRVANMELHDSNFGQREEIHKIKSRKRRQVEG